MKHAILAFLALLVMQATAAAAPMEPIRPAKNVETRITADRMSYLAEKHCVIFESNVHVLRPDFQLWSGKLTVFLKPAKEDPNKKGKLPSGMAAGELDRIVAEQNVRVQSDNRTGNCGRITYTADDGVLSMDRNPSLSDGENTISGEIIRYYTQENRSEVLGSAKRRVEAVFSSPNSPVPLKGGR